MPGLHFGFLKFRHLASSVRACMWVVGALSPMTGPGTCFSPPVHHGQAPTAHRQPGSPSASNSVKGLAPQRRGLFLVLTKVNHQWLCPKCIPPSCPWPSVPPPAGSFLLRCLSEVFLISTPSPPSWSEVREPRRPGPLRQHCPSARGCGVHKHPQPGARAPLFAVRDLSPQGPPRGLAGDIFRPEASRTWVSGSAAPGPASKWRPVG